ncbi:PRECURSOR OF CEP5 [Salix koriyanagi]|uniref:PRECURSOR OF CEP5 n=1 Tax=Salix koriyanagi TaxID=2511006 RepID=A0A9Q0U2W2_9ROSI|nr:PRECURSOR OF CEP5 [Salix koriyanagi]
MARGKLVFTSSLIIVLVLCYGITCSVGRLLKTGENTSSFSLRRDLVVSEARSEPMITPGPGYPDAESDDFKPTTPGHSPGAGHSTPGH